MHSITDYMESKRERLNDLYISAGNRTYMVGAQNGSFPDFGHHIENEMGGIWNHPIKLMDGFWLRVKRADRTDVPGEWLNEAEEFRNFNYYNEHSFTLEGAGLTTVRRQFAPDDTEGIVVAYTLTNTGSEAVELELTFLGRVDLCPVWFADEIGIIDGEDDAEEDRERGAIVGKDRDHPWFVVFGADRECEGAVIDRHRFGPERTAGKGITGELAYGGIAIGPGASETIHFFIAGSSDSREAALASYDRMKRDHGTMLEAKRLRYERMLTRTVLNIPDKSLQNVFNWVKFNNDWLVRHVPGIGNGLGAGHPEYPWWFGCDNSYALLGVLPLGEFGLVQDTLELLRQESERENGNGRIIHEISTCGAVSNKGNTQETPHFIQCVWDTFLWTGDMDKLKAMYPIVKQGLQWLLADKDPDGDLLPEGYGIIEIEGLNLELIDTAVYTCTALRAAGWMAELFGEPERAKEYRDTYLKLKDKINGDLWMEDEGLYAEAMGTPGNILQRLDLYIERAKSRGAMKEGIAALERMKLEMQAMDPDTERAWLFQNWVINTPMEMGIADRDKALRALDRMATEEFTGPWGTYLSGLYRTQMMTISTGVQAVAESRYDRIDESLRYVKLIESTFNKRLPGSISEMSPDYGCFVQAWTAYGIVYPLMAHMFGISPRAYWKQVTLRPRMPQGWTEASVKRVLLGSGDAASELDWEVRLGDMEDVYRLELRGSDWQVEVHVASDDKDDILVDGEPVQTERNEAGEHVVIFPNASIHEICVRHRI